ncbi:hypothetical protein BGZ70_008082 [Mortierella alpina]|uniref:Uncharacterized protein n=1 Tax=Mortierella alpina TaxID=64518 RepID=A0A9P6J4B3_MORAP|nr:hypothetical protein BGZ70_008082 [Mortierella alpina]
MTNFCPGTYYFFESRLSTTAGLSRNLHYVRTVEIAIADSSILQQLAGGMPLPPGDSALVSNTTCVNLQRLNLDTAPTLSDDHFPSIISNITKLLNQNHNVTHLTLWLPDNAINYPALIAISNLKHLRFLAVNFRGRSMIRTRTISLILRACLPLPNLTELRIDYKRTVDWNVDVDEDEDEDTDVDVEGHCQGHCLETIIKAAAIDRFSQTPNASKIKVLHLPDVFEDIQASVALLLLQSGLLELESCSILTFTEDLGPKDVEQIVREHCTTVKHLRSAGYNRYEIGRLRKLEQLAWDVCIDFEWCMCDLTLSRGWLSEMAGLKNLKSITLPGHLSMMMGQPEVEFIHEHWPLLREINFQEERISNVASAAPWRWLLDKRPSLHYHAL